MSARQALRDAVAETSLRRRVLRLNVAAFTLLAAAIALAAWALAGSRQTLAVIEDPPFGFVSGDEYRVLESRMEWVVAVLVVLAVAALVLGLYIRHLLEADILRPVEALSGQARAVAAGNLQSRIIVDGVEEITDLSASIERMRESLAAQLEELATAHAEAEAARDRLSGQAAELARSNRDLEQFAYVASHDLQEPLRKVASFTQLLAKRYSGQLDEDADRYINFAVDGAKRMQQLIQDLLMFSRVGRVEMSAVPVDLGELLAEVLADRAGQLAVTDGTVTHDPLPTVVGDPSLLRLVFANVIGNALKFRRPEVAPVVHVSAFETPTAWHIRVTDNGIGIDPKYAQQVFALFQRLHPKEVYPGTGIGLAVVQRIVEYHGGRVWVTAADGGGTAVEWTLPHVLGAKSPGEIVPITTQVS